ncbi:DUF2795 domain-containing protein [Streptosporangiaceae bacterium NEAU-GS5]|nr:DUF2795 domain-containing protein [Streptosporangiaceae bacterium NEAU-GS5]
MSSERGTDKHGPRLDDQHTHEADGTVRDGDPATFAGISPADVGRRSNLAKWLSDARYPATPTDLRAHAEGLTAPDEVMQALGELPELKFHNVGEVAEALGLGLDRQRW